MLVRSIIFYGIFSGRLTRQQAGATTGGHVASRIREDEAFGLPAMLVGGQSEQYPANHCILIAPLMGVIPLKVSAEKGPTAFDESRGVLILMIDIAGMRIRDDATPKTS
jgi:hypothetical protein